MHKPLPMSTLIRTHSRIYTTFYFSCNEYIYALTLRRCTLAIVLLIVTEVISWALASIKIVMHMWCKVLVKVFIASALRLSCSWTNNELSLGELMHLKCIYFSKHFAPYFSLESPRTWIKTAESDAVFGKSLVFIFFAGIFLGDQHKRCFYGKSRGLSTRGGPGARGCPKGGRWRGQMPRPRQLPPLEHRDPFGLSRTSSYTWKTDALQRRAPSAKQSTATTMIFVFGVKRLRDFSPGGRIRGPSSPPSSSPPSSSPPSPSTMCSISPSMCE